VNSLAAAQPPSTFVAVKGVLPDAGRIDDDSRTDLPVFARVPRSRDRSHGLGAIADYLDRARVTHDGRAELSERTGMITFPQIVIDGETLGGFQELLAADRALAEDIELLRRMLEC